MLFEWLGERINPGPVGQLSEHKNERTRTRLSAILTGLLALLFAALPLYFFYRYGHSGRGLWAEVFFIFSIEVLYLGIAYVLKPEPDTSNLGWFGGMMDHPFLISDDYNRFLMILAVLLFPGRLISIGIVDFFYAIKWWY